MNTGEETTYQSQKNNQNVGQVMDQKVENNDWKKVSISGVTGILIGAGATSAIYEVKANSKQNSKISDEADYVMAVDKSVSPESEVSEQLIADVPETEANEVVVHVYHHTDENSHVIDNPVQPLNPSEVRIGENGVLVAHVDDNMSFGDAFASARTQVGAGGVFQWHGGTYSTYYEKEWDSMPTNSKQEFAHRVSSEVIQQEQTNNVETAETQPEVHYLGEGTVAAQEESGSVGILMKVDGKVGGVVDTTGDGVFNISFGDENANGIIEETEVQDISDSGITMEQFLNNNIVSNGEVNLDALNQAVAPHVESTEPLSDYTDNADLAEM